MIEDMAARKPDTATADEVRRFQLHLIESGTTICNRNRIMTGVRFLFRVTLHQYDLAAEVWHLKEPDKLPPVLSLTRSSVHLHRR
jgi:integrase/recombinase XerD